MAKIITVSLNQDTETLWAMVKGRGIGPSEFMRRALNFYVNNSFKFGDEPVVEKNDNPVI